MKLLSLLLPVVLLISINLPAQETYQLKDSKMTIAGTSTLHDWVSDVVSVDVDALLTVTPTSIDEINKMNVKIAVKDIVSEKGKKMDNKTYDAFEEESNPLINFKLTKVHSITKESGSYKVKTSGLLSMAGQSKTIDLDVTAKRLAGGEIKFEGSKTLDMTSFSMDPPKALLGTIKTGEEVTVEFSIVLGSSTQN